MQKKCDVYILLLLWALQHNDSVCISQHNSIINKKLTCKTCMYIIMIASNYNILFTSLYTSLFEHVALVGVQYAPVIKPFITLVTL